MADAIITKRCSRCKQIKPILEFYKSRRHKYGYFCWCKNCAREYNHTEKSKTAQANYRHTENCKIAHQKYRRSEKGKQTSYRINQKYAITHPNNRRAKDAVNNAIFVGKLPKVNLFNCCDCGKKAEQYHHPSYKPEHRLDVIPLCRKCHKKYHPTRCNQNLV